MSWAMVAVIVLVAPALALIVVGMARSGHSCRASFLCPYCCDVGARVVLEAGVPTAAFCGDCHLGLHYEDRAAAPVDWPVVNRALDLSDGA